MPTIAPPPVNTPIADANGQLNSLWSRYYVSLGQTITTAFAPIDAAYWTSTTNPTLTNEQNLGALSPSGYLKVTVGAGIAVPSTTATIPSADLTGALPALDGSALTSLSASALTGALPAISGAALTALPNPLPAVSGANLTALNASALAGALPAISGAALTALASSALTGALPAVSGAALTAITGANVTHAVVTKVAADSPVTVLASYETILVDCTAGAVTITLPTPTSGRILTVKKVDVSANACTLTGTVDGTVNPTIGTQFQSRVLQADGTGWQILAGYL